MNILLFAALILYFAATVLQFTAAAMKKPALHTAARLDLLAGFAPQTAFTQWRGIPAAFLILSYAAFQPRDIKELMPALRSTWFALHIGSAAFSYAAFAIAGGLGVSYLAKLRRGTEETEPGMKQLDYMGYRLICLGFLLLTVVIFSGAIWAEQAWSSWWSWDPKETWALITWIFYAIYLHQRLRLKWQGKRMTILAIVALVLVLFTFAGVNLLLPGLHSYASAG